MKTQKELQEYYDKVKAREHRYQIKVKLLLRKAKEAGITVSEKEIDDAVKGK
jgi:hypothetical protein